MKVAVAVVSSLVLATSLARAQPVEESATDHDPAKATQLAVIGTAVPVALLGAAFVMPGDTATQRETRTVVGVIGAVGLVVGPSLGNLYATGSLAGGKGIALRAATAGIVGIVALGFTIEHGAEDFGCGLSDPDICTTRMYDHRTSNAIMAGTAVAGSLAVVGSIAWDIATARGHARAFNREHDIAVAPTVVTTGGAATAGLGLGGSF